MYPRRRGPLELAALTAAILIAAQLSLTHWFYLYLPWFLPFAVLAIVLPGAGPAHPRLDAAVRLRRVLRRACWARDAGCWELSGRQVSDLNLYRLYGERMTHGLVPYRDFDFEYPPGALAGVRRCPRS